MAFDQSPDDEWKYGLEEISRATENFSDNYLITEGALGRVYKGQLYKGQLLEEYGYSKKITIRRLDCEYEKGDALETEILMLKRFKNKNIVSIFGRCVENDEKIIIYEQAFHGTLDQHLNDATLTWSQRLQICLGVAKALYCVHYDAIHCDINSSKIFLDEDWKPKIYGFEHATKYPRSWRHRLLFTNNTTPKYDVYYFGVLLFELLCGRKPMIINDGLLEELDKIIDPNLRKQMDTESLASFTKIAFQCVNQHFVKRPTMDQIVKDLEHVLQLQLENTHLQEHPIAADETTSFKSLMMKFLEIPLSKIQQATNNFNDTIIASGGFGRVYRAKLDVLSIQSSQAMKGKCKDELPKIRKTVAIKRIKDEQGKQGFLTEIEVLTTCKHPNIISLLGYARAGDEMIIVYEYAVGGTLTDYLKSNDKKVNLTWTQRIQICLDVAHGINYLHTHNEEKPIIIHRDIKSDNILLDRNLKAIVADFGLSKFHFMREQPSVFNTNNIVGTKCYVDPEFLVTGNYNRASDIYSFGVVLFEVLCGRLAYDSIYECKNMKGLAPIARRCYTEGTLKDLMDPKMIEDDDHVFTLNRGPNQESFDKFSRIAYECVAETQVKRPTMEVIINELQNALKLQGEAVVLLRFQLSDIVLATKNFAETCCIGSDKNGMVYKAELDHFGNNSSFKSDGNNDGEPSKKRFTVAIKRIITGRKGWQVNQGFFEELERRTSYKHPKIANLLGFCDAGGEMILVYEHTSNKSLDEYLTGTHSKNNLSWTQRLHMCLDIACGIEYLHTKMGNYHSDIKSANILLDKDCLAKIAYFGISKLNSANQEVDMKVYEDPEYETTGKLEMESDIYSFGVVLFEILCGRLAYDPEYILDKGLACIARQCYNNGTIMSLIDPNLKKFDKASLHTFIKIAVRCLGETAARPKIEIVTKELKRALNLQERLYSQSNNSFFSPYS